MDESKLSYEEKQQARMARSGSLRQKQQLASYTREEQKLIRSEEIATAKRERTVEKFVTDLERQLHHIREDATCKELREHCEAGIKSDLETCDFTICEQYRLASTDLVINEFYIRYHYPQTYDTLSRLLCDRISGKILQPRPHPERRERG